jgi:hypothetical protein
MSPQYISQFMVLVGVLISALGAFGSYHYGKQEERRASETAANRETALNDQLAKFQTTLDTKTDLILKSVLVKPDNTTWLSFTASMIPPGVADYLLLLFIADKGRISGKIRVKGSQSVSLFSTTANARNPVAIPNSRELGAAQYRVPTVLEYSITESTVPDAKLSILTAGFIDTRGQEPPLNN